MIRDVFVVGERLDGCPEHRGRDIREFEDCAIRAVLRHSPGEDADGRPLRRGS